MKKFFYLFILLSLLIPQVYADQTDLPRGPLGKPDLNGVWQVLNSANYNLEAHSASAALAMIEGPVVPIPHPSVVRLGAVGSVPAGLGVVEGGTIPYKKAPPVRKARWVRTRILENKDLLGNSGI